MTYMLKQLWLATEIFIYFSIWRKCHIPFVCWVWRVKHWNVQQFSGSNLWEKCFWSAVCTYSCRPQLHGPSLSYVMLNCEGCVPSQHGILRRGGPNKVLYSSRWRRKLCNLTRNHCWCRHRKGCCWILSTQRKLTDCKSSTKVWFICLHM